jgi:hypothetical protein
LAGVDREGNHTPLALISPVARRALPGDAIFDMLDLRVRRLLLECVIMRRFCQNDRAWNFRDASTFGATRIPTTCIEFAKIVLLSPFNTN